eukprot:1849744-Prymnesium_polylepis.1
MDGDIDRALLRKTMKPFEGRCAGPPLTQTLILGVLVKPVGYFEWCTVNLARCSLFKISISILTHRSLYIVVSRCVVLLQET